MARTSVSLPASTIRSRFILSGVPLVPTEMVVGFEVLSHSRRANALDVSRTVDVWDDPVRCVEKKLWTVGWDAKNDESPLTCMERVQQQAAFPIMTTVATTNTVEGRDIRNADVIRQCKSMRH